MQLLQVSAILMLVLSTGVQANTWALSAFKSGDCSVKQVLDVRSGSSQQGCTNIAGQAQSFRFNGDGQFKYRVYGGPNCSGSALIGSGTGVTSCVAQSFQSFETYV
ncbi:hypothetical protein B0J13DRAFT_631018 [Dactylonectria estremocensis]|uniref:Uncharacterized protein n=1 Tax=Dactylonectria estremocensis TaxID=1079267 RepID=A0A9P9D7P6_9HYPO|nr:hypothetical protein B0J13DRAFT_631018 [Dactylonectria estremocensis]